jgi:hypothetical protein
VSELYPYVRSGTYRRDLRTGFGQHGDYVFGWEGDSLQRAMDNCKDEFGHPDLCNELTLLTDDEMNSCTQPALVPEKVEGECKSAIIHHHSTKISYWGPRV